MKIDQSPVHQSQSLLHLCDVASGALIYRNLALIYGNLVRAIIKNAGISISNQKRLENHYTLFDETCLKSLMLHKVNGELVHKQTNFAQPSLSPQH
jgi:hypothetical protein